jgi:hypothetical protein
MGSTLGQASGLTHKHKTRLEKLARDKCFILIRKFVNYGSKIFITLALWFLWYFWTLTDLFLFFLWRWWPQFLCFRWIMSPLQTVLSTFKNIQKTKDEGWLDLDDSKFCIFTAEVNRVCSYFCIITCLTSLSC